MIGYLWIGLGGALGGMGRAWLAVMVARITGPQFPWGTMLINITGSFVIGFFGTFRTSGSRFAVPVDVRAFVMVGICGGFTTFSSFSLQTLELRARWPCGPGSWQYRPLCGALSLGRCRRALWSRRNYRQ